jgi:hypothetical protein
MKTPAAARAAAEPISIVNSLALAERPSQPHENVMWLSGFNLQYLPI